IFDFCLLKDIEYRTRNLECRGNIREENDSMRAMAFAQHGELDVLQMVDLTKPSIDDDEVLVQVKACALNHLDIWVRKGLSTKIPMPHIGGCEIAGVLAEVGRKAGSFQAGQRVLISPGQSCMHCDWCNQA